MIKTGCRLKYIAGTLIGIVSAMAFMASSGIEAEELGVRSFTGSSSVVLTSFCRTKDGGAAAAGYAEAAASGPGKAELEDPTYDAIVVKFNSAFEIEWQKTYGKDKDDYAYAITPTDDGGYVVAGETYSFAAVKNDALVFRIDGSGGLVWAKMLGATDEDRAVDVKRGEDGGFVVLGTMKPGGTAEAAGPYKIMLFGLGPYGDLLWQKSYGGAKDDWAGSLTRTRVGEYIVAGCTRSFGQGDVNAVVFKTDAGGVIKWQKFYGTPQDDYLFSSVEANDGGYLVVGETFVKETDTKKGESNVIVIRIDDFGKDVWQKSYGYGKNDYALGAEAAGKHGFVIAGGSLTADGGNESWALKIDWSGKAIWKKSYDLGGKETLYSSLRMKDGRILGLGSVNSDSMDSPFIVVGDKKGSVGSACSAVQESPIVKKWLSSGSGVASYVAGNPALKVKGIKSEMVITDGALSGETVCPAE